MLDADVLVVGGGPAGSSIAHALAARGVDVLVVDRARFPRPKPCAEYLSPQASRILSRMGALDQVEGSGAAALSGIRIYAPNGSVIAGDFVAKHGTTAIATAVFPFVGRFSTRSSSNALAAPARASSKARRSPICFANRPAVCGAFA